jgi:small subunit ribosomal protein S6
VLEVASLSAHHVREYETFYVLKADMEDEAAIEFLQKMKGVVEKNGGKNLKVTNQGRRKLAWERDRHQKGMFVHHQYLGKPGIVAEYERTLGIDENVLLRQTVLVDKAVEADTRQPEEDVLAPPAVKERREEEMAPRGRRDRDDDDDDRDRDRGGRSRRDEEDFDDE